MQNKDLHCLSPSLRQKYHWNTESMFDCKELQNCHYFTGVDSSFELGKLQKKRRLPLWWRQGFQAFIDSTLSHWTLLPQTQGTMISSNWDGEQKVSSLFFFLFLIFHQISFCYLGVSPPFSFCDFDACRMFAYPQEYSLILPSVEAFEAVVQQLFYQAAWEERSIRLVCHSPTPIQCQGIRPWRHFVSSDQMSALNGRNNNRPKRI